MLRRARALSLVVNHWVKKFERTKNSPPVNSARALVRPLRPIRGSSAEIELSPAIASPDLTSICGSADIWNIHEEAVVKFNERETAESSKHPFGIPDRQAAIPLLRIGPIHDDGIIVPCSKPGSDLIIPLAEHLAASSCNRARLLLAPHFTELVEARLF